MIRRARRAWRSARLVWAIVLGLCVDLPCWWIEQWIARRRSRTT